MKIMAIDVPAVDGGALSILYQFYKDFKDDEDNMYYLIVSKPFLKDTSNVKVLRYPWVKKSWLHRLFFDKFVAPKIIKRLNIDKVISLQNVIIPNTKVFQTLYLHNSLPFVDYKFSLFENKKLWIYQNLIGKRIIKSVKNANKVIVQSEWMKQACIKMAHVQNDKIEVTQPKLDIKVSRRFSQTKDSTSSFFFPASGMDFKNHKIIIDACLKLKNEGIDNYKVTLTLNGNETKKISNLFKIVIKNDLPVEFIGFINRNEVLNFYSSSTLIFPSYIETVGLPLIEAKMHGTPIIVSDCAFSREILNNYQDAYFFNPFNADELMQLMKNMIKINP